MVNPRDTAGTQKKKIHNIDRLHGEVGNEYTSSTRQRGAMRCVTVGTSAFLACHQCYCAGFQSRLGIESSGCSMWNFLKLVARGFLRVLRFPPLLRRLMVQQKTKKRNKAQLNEISTLSDIFAELSLRTTWHATHVARDKRSMCCTWFAHDCVQTTWEDVLEIVRGAVRKL